MGELKRKGKKQLPAFCQIVKSKKKWKEMRKIKFIKFKCSFSFNSLIYNINHLIVLHDTATGTIFRPSDDE